MTQTPAPEHPLAGTLGLLELDVYQRLEESAKRPGSACVVSAREADVAAGLILELVGERTRRRTEEQRTADGPELSRVERIGLLLDEELAGRRHPHNIAALAAGLRAAQTLEPVVAKANIADDSEELAAAHALRDAIDGLLSAVRELGPQSELLTAGALEPVGDAIQALYDASKASR